MSGEIVVSSVSQQTCGHYGEEFENRYDKVGGYNIPANSTILLSHTSPKERERQRVRVASR